MPRQSRATGPLLLAGLIAGLFVNLGPAARGADTGRGAALFQAHCASCHNDRPDALGPSLAGVVGRGAASLPGFRYSGPLRRSGLTWTARNLTDFLMSPQTVVAGNRMPFEGVPSRADAEAIVAYLATLRAPAPP